MQAPRGGLSIRAHLFLLALCAMLPILGFAAYVSSALIEQDRESIRRGAMDRARAMLTAVESELDGTIGTLAGLATSEALDRADLRAFHAEAMRVLKSQEDWTNISLSLPSSLQQVVNVKVPYGAPLPTVADPASARKVLQSGGPVAGSVSVGNVLKDFVVPIRVPVRRDGAIAYILTAAVKPASFKALIQRQQLPSGWVISVIDADGHFVARVPEREPGSLASESFRGRLQRSPEGWFRGTTVEGVDTFTAYIRSGTSNWTVGFAIPAEFVDASARRSTIFLTLGALVAILLAFMLASMVGRRISGPIVSLSARARAFGQGETTGIVQAGTVKEVGVVAEALEEAGRAVQEQRQLIEREKDALMSADRAKDEFIAMMSHEMRNPLAALHTASQVLQRADPTQEPAANARRVIERQTAHMVRLIEDLLDVNRIVMGKATLVPELLDLAEVAADVVRSWRDSGRLAGGHQVELKAAPVHLRADRSRLEQVLSNLLDNAVKFSPRGTTIRVAVFAEGSDAVLRVTDEGEGMESTRIERMFDLFVQGTQGLERRTGGLGVGLALVKRLVELHGGSVSAASDGPGKGASFTVRLPAAA